MSLSGSARRRKGVTFEREIAHAFEEAGFAVRGLEQGGDHFAAHHDGRTFRIECKRHERLRLPEWLDQLDRDTLGPVHGVLVFRQARKRAYVVQPLADWLVRS